MTEILPNGGLVLGAGCGITPEIVDKADKIILEVNTSLPSFNGMYDIVPDLIPPHRKPFLITSPNDRIGTGYVQIDQDKVVGVVESNLPDNGKSFPPMDEHSEVSSIYLLCDSFGCL